MIQILNIEPDNYSPQAKAILQTIGNVVERPLSPLELKQQIPSYDVLITRLRHKIDQHVIDAGINLKAIVTATTGLDHINIEYAKSKGVAVLSLKGETEFLRTVSSTAEHTWAILLALVRNIPQAFEHVCKGGWDRDSYRGHELDGQTLGILGLGRIGQKVALYGLAFGMKVVAFDPYIKEWIEGVEQAITLDELLHCSNILSIHIPLNEDTAEMLGHKELAQLPPNALVVNTSRGSIIQEDALIDLLTNSHLSGAALDVIDNEQDIQAMKSSKLLIYAQTHDNLLITPHIGGATYEAMIKTEIFMAKKIVRFFRGVQ